MGVLGAVNAGEYEQIRNGRRRGVARRLGEAHPRACCPVSPVAAVLARAARDHRRREAGVAAWGRIADPEWHSRTEVDGVRGDVLIVAVADAGLGLILRRQQAVLERRLRGAAHGLRRFRFVVQGVVGGGELEQP